MKIVFLSVTNQHFYTMVVFIEQYETAKKQALNFMKAGELNAYFKALHEVSTHKKMLWVCAN